MTEIALAARDVVAGYGGQRVLRGASIEVPAGSVAILIGPNGHGKTTLLRCISGLMRPWRGAVQLHGRDVTGVEPHHLVRLGLVHIPQGDLIFPDMTVYDNLMMGAYLPKAFANAQTKLEEVYAILPRLKERRDQIASTLSGGERRMLGIGRGLMTDGQVLMLDEPSLGLAPLANDQIYEVIAELKARGLTLLIVEENASRAVDVGDRVFLLDDGEIVWQGLPHEMAENEEIFTTYLGA